MAATGFKLPTTDTAVSGTWTTPTNVQSDTDADASATAAPGKNVTASRDAGGFGLSVPTYAAIVKVELKARWKVDTTLSIATLRLNAKVGATVLANHDNVNEPTVFTIDTFDITADRAWTPADFADGTWFVRFNAVQGNSSTAVTFSFDAVYTQVTYMTEGGQVVNIGGPIQEFTGTPGRSYQW